MSLLASTWQLMLVELHAEADLNHQIGLSIKTFNLELQVQAY